MEESYIAKRITQLRMARNISEYQMSLEFFDEENVESPTVQKAIDAIRKLSEQDAALALAMIQRLSLPLREGGAEQ